MVFYVENSNTSHIHKTDKTDSEVSGYKTNLQKYKNQ